MVAGAYTSLYGESYKTTSMKGGQRVLNIARIKFKPHKKMLFNEQTWGYHGDIGISNQYIIVFI